MARKNKNLASFEELASSNIGKASENEGQNNDNVNINGDINPGNDIDINVDVNNKPITNNDENINDNNNVNVNVNKNEDYLDQIINSSKKKKGFEQKPTGIYLEDDLAKILNDLAKKGGRGAKSRIVNEALRAIFTEKGLIK